MQTKKNIWTAGLMICLLLLSGIGFTSSDKDEVDDTILLNSFGPSPALRGGDLRQEKHARGTDVAAIRKYGAKRTVPPSTRCLTPFAQTTLATDHQTENPQPRACTCLSHVPRDSVHESMGGTSKKWRPRQHGGIRRRVLLEKTLSADRWVYTG